jgi:NADH-quinone oxidoreductase subunit F
MKKRNIVCSVELRMESESDAGAALHSAGSNPAGVKRSGCHGFCEMGPLVLIESEGFLYTKVRLADCEQIIEETIGKGLAVERLSYRKNGKTYPKRNEIPFYDKQTRLVLEHCGRIDATSIKEYFAVGGCRAFEKALFDMNAAQIIDAISESNLRGRGGEAFPRDASGLRLSGSRKAGSILSATGTKAIRERSWTGALWRGILTA